MTFRIFQINFPNFAQFSEFCSIFRIFQPKKMKTFFLFLFLGLTSSFPNFLDDFPNLFTTFQILVYFPNSGLLSEFWPTMDQEPGS